MNASKYVEVYILASGKGTRMGELTRKKPKPLLPLNGKSIISRLLDYLSINEYQANVNYAYLKDEWVNIFKEYPSVNFYDTSGFDNIIQCFFYMLTKNRFMSDIIILMSADLFFDYRLIKEAVEFHISSLGDVSLFLNMNCGRWKKWVYDIKGEDLTDIKINAQIQSTERYFIIFSKKALINYTKNFTINLGNTQTEFDLNKSYGQGICFLTKNMLDNGIKIKCKSFENELININNLDDYSMAEHLAKKLDLE